MKDVGEEGSIKMQGILLDRKFRVFAKDKLRLLDIRITQSSYVETVVLLMRKVRGRGFIEMRMG